MKYGVTTSFVQSTNWREAAENEIKLFDFIEINALITFLFGGYYWRLIIQFLQILGYLSGLKMLCGICRNLLQRFLRKWLGLNRNERLTIEKIRNRQYSQSNNWHEVMLTMKDAWIDSIHHLAMFHRPALVARVVKIHSHHNICHVPYDRPTRVDLLEKYPHAAEV